MEDSDNHYQDNQEYQDGGDVGDEDQQQDYYQDNGGGDGGGDEGENYNQENYNNSNYDDQYYQEYDYNAFEPIWVRALYDFDATNDTEISFKANDIVCITEDYNDGWWCGDIHGQVGRVPANYFEYLDQDQDHDHSGYGQSSYQQQDTYDDQQQQQPQQDQSYEQQPAQPQTANKDDDDDDEDGGGDDDDAARKEKMRQKREMFKREMKELQDKLKQQQLDKNDLGAEIEQLEKEKEAIESQVRGMKLLKYINLEIFKTDCDIDLDSDVSMQARQAGIGITQDLRAIRTYLTSLKSTQLDQPKKQFDLKLEELEKRMAANLNNLDVCDNLKKSVQMDLALLQSEMELLEINEQVSGLPLPPPPVSGSTAGSNPGSTLPPPPIQVVGGGPPAFLQTPTVSLSEKDKRKSLKEAKKLEKAEAKDREREEKEKKKEKKREEEQIWKPSKINK